MNKRIFIAGHNGMVGSALFLLEKGYEVHGIKRRASSFNTERIDHIYESPDVKDRQFILHYGDLIEEMVKNDLEIARKNRLLIKSGYDVNQPAE